MIQKLRKINTLVAGLLKNEEGSTAIEYALIASAVGLALAAVMPTLSSNISATYSSIAGYITGA